MSRGAEGDVGLVLGRRGARAERSGGRDEARRDLVRADDADALALEDRREAGEQAVVAAAKQLRQIGRPLDRAPVEPQVGEFRPGHRADHRHFGDALRLQRAEQFADLAHPHPDMRVGFDRRDRRTRRRRSGTARVRPCGRRPRPRAERRRRRTGWRAAGARRCRRPAGRRAHASSPLPSRGTQIARSPPSRRKATICCTASWSGKASATSSTRSFSVPLPKNSIL